MMHKEALFPPELPQPRVAYSPAVKAGPSGVLTISIGAKSLMSMIIRKMPIPSMSKN